MTAPLPPAAAQPSTAREERKPPTSRPVIVYRCWHCARVIAEAAEGSIVRIKCACNEWNVIEAP